MMTKNEGTKHMLKRRKLKTRHYLVLLVILGLALFLNIRLFYINTIECYSNTTGVCSGIVSYKISEYLAYASIVILAIYGIYLYLVKESKEKVKEQVSEPLEA